MRDRFAFVCYIDFFTRELELFVREFDVFVREFDLLVRVSNASILRVSRSF